MKTLMLEKGVYVQSFESLLKVASIVENKQENHKDLNKHNDLGSHVHESHELESREVEILDDEEVHMYLQDIMSVENEVECL